MSKKAILTVLFTFSSIFLYSQAIKEHGHLKVAGTQLVNKKGQPVVLRGLSFGWHQWWPRFYNADVAKWLHKDWNASVLRLAVGIEPRGAYLDNPSLAKEKIRAVVNQAIKDDFYVIIDWHSHRIHLKEATIFFQDMAKLYGKYPNVIYEIYNEPEKDSWENIRSYSNSVITAIRKIDKDNIILVGTPNWGQGADQAADNPLKGHKNIMYTLHFYADTHQQWLRDRASYALKKGLPIFISECAGMSASGDGVVNQVEWQKWINWAEQSKISWVAWSIADKKETCSMLYPKAASTGGWQKAEISPWGLQVRNLLRTFPEK